MRVDEYGKVTDARVKDSYVRGSSTTPTSAFSAAALEAAGKAVFRPARLEGKSVPYWTGLTFNWGKGKASEQPRDKAEVKAVLISAPVPSYHGLKTQARFIIAVLVDEHGKVSQTRIQDFTFTYRLESSIEKAVQEAVLKAANQALFRPALQGGQPVASWSRLDFKLEPSP